ncbi:TrkH family potassium uptake protein [Hydrogenimonas cancrithermarum]|uniref:Trk system potassium transporter TrkH n=1 Tax=Hydrogenimonas cancrithermarum TaxID=2993563 RepID=A0ABM8FHL4_9BACT|nr:TrkH family potassium uptake protein [Hydrogenimonas cancrithermarum]BDY11707.1 Trk system potassium transporter TrkH [Hydrogenimonas cancrithermarum]
MDFKSIFKVLSLIGVTLALFFALDVAIGIIYGEIADALAFFDLLFLFVNGLIWFALRSHPVHLKIKESILTVNILWIFIGIAGAVPLYLYTPITFASAFFEAISGFTTTGATIYSDIEHLPRMILFHRSLMHWLGGMGIIVLGVGLLSIINPTGSLSLFKAEATGIQIEKLTPKIKDTALSLWAIYLFLTLSDTLLLKGFGMNWFDAINHAFSTISTGGFSTKNSSLGYFQSDGIVWVTTLFMLLSGINFLAHLKLFYRDISGYGSEEVLGYLKVFFILSLLLSFIHTEMGGDAFYHAVTHSFFTIASVMTTTGFATTDYGTWSHLAIVVIFLAMLVGGNAGSTAGGIKVIRYLIIFKTLRSELKRIVHPNAVISVFVDGVKLRERVLSSTFGFFFLFVLTVVAMALFMYARGSDAMTAISGALAIVGNIGPGFSAVGPAENFGFFQDVDKIVLSMGMIIGRLECYTVFVLFTASFWKKF